MSVRNGLDQSVTRREVILQGRSVLLASCGGHFIERDVPYPVAGEQALGGV
jgi:hypothetical protein